MTSPLDELNALLGELRFHTGFATDVNMPHTFKHEAYTVTITVAKSFLTQVAVLVEGHSNKYMDERHVVARNRHSQKVDSAVILNGVALLNLPDDVYWFQVQLPEMPSIDDFADEMYQLGHGPLA
jgi:hypothetical protein